MTTTEPTGRPFRPALGFAAGFLATLLFHQIAVALLWAMGIASFAPYSTEATAPLGVPAVISLAFWGGVWGIVYAAVERRFPSGAGYWLVAFLFGAILPTLVALLIVVPLKGGSIGAGWNPALWTIGLMVNGAWGLGTGLFYRLGQHTAAGRRAAGA